MKKMLMLGCALAAVVSLPVSARAGSHGGAPCCVEQACTIEKPTFHVEVIEKKYTVPVKVIYPYIVKARIIEKDVPFCRQVPVCIVDPCTGCKRTEYKEEQGVERVKVKVYDILPPEKECEEKLETRIAHCVTIDLGFTSVPVAPCAVPCCGN
jgi:hypothetical protein